MAERLRGRAGQAQRRRRLQAEPLCRLCQAKGVTRIATVPDHVIPLHQGGSDDDGNIQCLCQPCHDEKTSREDGSNHAAVNHPDWLKPSKVPLTIVSGPPCSGKTTYIEQNAKPGDIVIDLDNILMGIRPGYRHWSAQLDSALLNQAIRTRNALLGSLARRDAGRAWFIVSAPSPHERSWWRSKLGGQVLLLHPGADECKCRALIRGTPRAISGVDDWDLAASRHWEPKRTKPVKATVGDDGWPV